MKRGKLTFILVRGIGEAFIENDVDPAEVRAFLEREARRMIADDRYLDWHFACRRPDLSAAVGFFAGSETALTASSRASMARLEKNGNRSARIVNRLLASASG